MSALAILGLAYFTASLLVFFVIVCCCNAGRRADEHGHAVMQRVRNSGAPENHSQIFRPQPTPSSRQSATG